MWKGEKKNCNVSLLIYRAVAYTQKINPIIAKKIKIKINYTWMGFN